MLVEKAREALSCSGLHWNKDLAPLQPHESHSLHAPVWPHLYLGRPSELVHPPHGLGGNYENLSQGIFTAVYADDSVNQPPVADALAIVATPGLGTHQRHRQ